MKNSLLTATVQRAGGGKPLPILSRGGLALCALLSCRSPVLLHATDRAEYARQLKTELVQKIKPYWYDTAIDHTNGGYVLSDDAAKKAPPATEKQLVTQSRMIWGFSHAYRSGLGDGHRD